MQERTSLLLTNAERELKEKMEMEMRAREDIEIGQDITPPLSPLSFSLHDSFLHSHCTSCFSPLPSPSPSPSTPPSLLYCSPSCSNSDSSLHISSAENHLLLLLHSYPSLYPHGDSSDLRAAIRFLHSQSATCNSLRIAGLLTNRDKLTAPSTRANSDDDDDGDLLARIRDGARAMAAARRMRDGVNFSSEEEAVLEEAALCLVLTNAVEVQDKSGRTLGVAVYSSSFCWINHSCSPNACYRISLAWSPETSSFSTNKTPMRIESGVCSNSVLRKELKSCYGPRLVVRSIRRIKKGEEVTVTYTDLLQPKAMRQSELWSRYRFICCCRRCSASSLTYVDRALEEISVVHVHSLSSNSSFYTGKATRRLTEYIDDAIGVYLSAGDPESCCDRLEQVLTLGLRDEKLECSEEKSQPTYRLQPLHHLSLNAYTTLASAYKVRARDLLALVSEVDDYMFKAFEMSRTSAAYSLLLLGATHHLFQHESSLLVSAANFWTSAGESLLTCARSPVWNELARRGLPVSNLSSNTKHRCVNSNCLLIDKFKTLPFQDQAQYAVFEDVSSKFLDCVTDYTHKVWRFLVHGSCHLREFKDPFDFSWLRTATYCNTWEILVASSGKDGGSDYGSEENTYGNEAHGYTNHGRVSLFQLGVHCLLYGGYLASICFGEDAFLNLHVQNILDSEENF
ncbi:hypothetical protein UlMin_036403 [Ulmus minor]